MMCVHVLLVIPALTVAIVHQDTTNQLMELVNVGRLMLAYSLLLIISQHFLVII